MSECVSVSEIAMKVWQMDWPTIASLKGMDVAERDTVQTALHQKYGKEVDLNGTPDDIREAVHLARL